MKKLIDLLLYSNFWIACCAVAMTLQTQLLLHGQLEYNPLIGLIFFATLMVYAVHRIVGLFRLQEFIQEGRYFIINKFKSHIWIYATVGLLGSIYCFFQLQRPVQIAIVLPAFFSMGYILPVFGRSTKLRLRDFNGIKIFLVASVWAYVTVLLPALQYPVAQSTIIWMFIERFIFVFAITLPFDIRDLKVDEFNQVKTIPSVLGINRTLLLAMGLLDIFWIICYFSYDLNVFWAMLATALFTALLIYQSPKQQHDYYFTGFLDGTMILQPVLVYLMY
jgi:4-hydroxybenzoate polyprenyltransferase